MTERHHASDDRSTLLLVKDSPTAVSLQYHLLSTIGYRVIPANPMVAVDHQLAVEQPDLIILELERPSDQSLDLCRHLRPACTIPIIIVSGSATSADRTRGLQAGATDYLSKSYDPLELAARIGAILRRRRMASSNPQPLRVGPLMIDVTQRRVTLDGTDVALTPSEYRLLVYLAENAGQTLTADGLITELWGDTGGAEVASLHLLINRLRRKLQDSPKQPRFIVTKQGIGYMLQRSAA